GLPGDGRSAAAKSIRERVAGRRRPDGDEAVMKKGSLAGWSEVGALTTAGTVAATIFCCLPFATGVVGAAVAAFGARLMPLQPLFIGLSVSSLAYSFYQAYQPGAACATDNCDVPAALRRRRVVLWLVTLAVVAMLTAKWWANWAIYWTL